MVGAVTVNVCVAAVPPPGAAVNTPTGIIPATDLAPGDCRSHRDSSDA
jgi:hypothetical protein